MTAYACFSAHCRRTPVYKITKITGVNTVTGEKCRGSQQYACDEHKDAVIALIHHPPEVERL